MAEATHVTTGTASPLVAAGADSRITGYLVACVVPAVFWTLLYAAAGWLFGFPISAPTLFTTGLAIGGFLAIVFSALTLNPRS